MSCLFLLQSCELTHVTLGFSHYLSSACRKNIIYKIIKIPNAKLYFSLCKYWDFGYHEGEISISVKGSNISITIVKASKILIIVIGKVWIFWKGHKIRKNLPLKIWRYSIASNFKWKIFFWILWPSQNIRTLTWTKILEDMNKPYDSSQSGAMSCFRKLLCLKIAERIFSVF